MVLLRIGITKTHSKNLSKILNFANQVNIVAGPDQPGQASKSIKSFIPFNNTTPELDQDSSVRSDGDIILIWLKL